MTLSTTKQSQDGADSVLAEKVGQDLNVDDVRVNGRQVERSAGVAQAVSAILGASRVQVNYLVFENGELLGADVERVMMDVATGVIGPEKAASILRKHGIAPDPFLEWKAEVGRPMPWEGIGKFQEATENKMGV